MALLNLKGTGYSWISEIQIVKNNFITFVLNSGELLQRLQKLDGTIVSIVSQKYRENFTIMDISKVQEILSQPENIQKLLYEYIKAETYIKDLSFQDELDNSITHKEVLDPDTGEVTIVEV